MAAKAMAGGQGHGRHAPARLGAFGIAHAFDGPGRVLGLGGPGVKGLGLLLAGVEKVEVGNVAGQQIRLRETGMRIFGRRPGHGHGARHHFVKRRRCRVGRRHHALALADEDAQTQVAGFGSLDVLAFAQALADGQRGGLEGDRVGGLGTGPSGAAEHVVEQPQKSLAGLGRVAGKGLAHGIIPSSLAPLI